MWTLPASGGILEELGINLRVLATQAAIFALTFIVLSRLLFGRVMSHAMRREDELRRMKESAERELARAESLVKELDAHQARIRSRAEKLLNEAIREAKAAAAAEVARAQEEAHHEILRGREAVAAEKQKAMSAMRGEIERLAFAAAERILETKVDPAAHGPAVRKFLSEGD